MYIRAFAVLIATGCAILLALMGLEWIEKGHGLNPWIAFPAAVFIYALPFALLIREAHHRDCQLEDLLEELETVYEILDEEP